VSSPPSIEHKFGSTAERVRKKIGTDMVAALEKE
jgi:hypothetical protein